MSIGIISSLAGSSELFSSVEALGLSSVVSLDSVEEFISHPRRYSFDLIILESGSVSEIEDVGRSLTDAGVLSEIPLIVHGPDTPGHLHSAYAYGAIDYIRMPLAGFELQLRLKNALIMAARWESDKQVIRGLGLQLQQFNHLSTYLREQSLVDSLTGILNRRAFDFIEFSPTT